jgi:DNA integrity scanning protein DisA with diadenylate cyclase activity
MRLFEARAKEFRDALYEELDKRLQTISEVLEKKGSIVPISRKVSNVSFVLLNLFLVIMTIIVWFEPTVVSAVLSMAVIYGSLVVFVIFHEKWERKMYKEW